MKCSPSALPESARLALALAGLALAMAVAGPAATEAKKGRAPKKAAPVAQTAPAPAPAKFEKGKGKKPEKGNPGEPAAEQPAPPPAEQPAEEAPSPNAQKKLEKEQQRHEKQREQARAPNPPGRTVVTAQPTPAPSTPAKPSQPAPEQGATSGPLGDAPPAGTPPARRLSTRGRVPRRRAAQRRAATTLPAAIVGAVEESAATAIEEGSAPEELNTRPASGEPVDEDAGGGSPVTQTVEEIVEVVPESVMIALGGLLALSLVLAGASLLTGLRARRLERQRHELLQEVGLLQSALLPPVPGQLGALCTSVAYRPAEGPGAGGDFYDALPLSDGRAAFILGDVSGHGRRALERTAFLRYTLRAYLEAGLEPRMALQVAGRVVDDQLSGDFATVVLAVHDPDTASLTFACAGHPAPIVVGPSTYEPVLPGSSPPLGIGMRTGLRQTTIPLATGSVACLFTDGLTEARTERGILGRPRLADIVAELGRDADASELLERVASEARLVTDDMAACLIAPTGKVTGGGFQREELELAEDELGGNVARRFLEACGVSGEGAARAELEAAEVARRFGGAVLCVTFGTGEPQADVTPRNVESIEASSRRAAAS